MNNKDKKMRGFKNNKRVVITYDFSSIWCGRRAQLQRE